MCLPQSMQLFYDCKYFWFIFFKKLQKKKKYFKILKSKVCAITFLLLAYQLETWAYLVKSEVGGEKNIFINVTFEEFNASLIVSIVQSNKH